MSCTKRLTILLLALAFVAGGARALAHDLNPPWYRGNPLSATFHWQAPPGAGLLPVEYWWVDGPSHYPWSGESPWLEQGQSPDGTFIQIWLPNFIDDLPWKFMRVQLNWTGPSTAPPEIIEVGGYDSATGSDLAWVNEYSSPIQPWTQPDGGYQYHDLVIRPNPDWEYVNIVAPPDVWVDQIVIDTISIPEPATLALVGMGGLALLRRRRRPAT